MDGYRLARPVLFALDPERAHNLGLSLMRFASRISAEPMPVKTALGELANPLGLAGGYDKTGRHLESLARLGFGYLVAGTFTLKPWPGNPKPRVARNKEDRTLVNALGFPNPGIDAFIGALDIPDAVEGPNRSQHQRQDGRRRPGVLRQGPAPCRGRRAEPELAEHSESPRPAGARRLRGARPGPAGTQRPSQPISRRPRSSTSPSSQGSWGW